MVAFGDRGGGNSTVGVFGTINRCLWSWASVNSRDHYPYHWCRQNLDEDPCE
jgi:hypothetical protein